MSHACVRTWRGHRPLRGAGGGGGGRGASRSRGDASLDRHGNQASRLRAGPRALGRARARSAGLGRARPAPPRASEANQSAAAVGRFSARPV